jgi:hypothetical protein
MTTVSEWASADVELADTGQPMTELAGFDDFEAAMVKLTHPMIGVFYRRDGRLGSYSIWHDRLRCTVGELVRARFDLLDRLEVVPFADQNTPHSVLIQPETEFIIQLPPRAL